MRHHSWFRFGSVALTVSLGCQSTQVRVDTPPIEARGQAEEKPTTLPPPAVATPTAPPVVNGHGSPKVPISLDAVLQLGERQNPQLAAARAKVEQAHAEEQLAALRWLPDVNVGVGYYRHEGGIQDQDGTLVNSSTGALLGGVDLNARLDLRAAAFAKLDAARKTLQNQGELKKLDYELTLQAAERYIDVLSALTGSAVAARLRDDLRKEIEPLRKAAESTPALNVEVRRYEAEESIQSQLVVKLDSAARHAAMELANLLGLDPCVELLPIDAQLVPLALVDASRPECDLVAQVLANGPGVREVEAILGLIQKGLCDAQGHSRYLPVFTAQALEGGFGAGPGSGLSFANRFDFGVQARWNLTELMTADAQRRIALAGLAQTQYRYADLRGKLTLGVRDSVETIHSGDEQLRLARESIDRSEAALTLSKKRLDVAGVAGGASYSEVLLAERSLALARANHITILRDYNKAQLRLLILLGK